MKETLIISTKEGGLHHITIQSKSNLPADAALFCVDTNQMVLGSSKWIEWQEISGNSNKQKVFFSKVRKISFKELK